VSGLGAANSMVFANTALKADGRGYDEDRINTLYLPFNVPMTDKANKPVTVPVIALVGLPNLYDAQANPHRHVLVDYGDDHALVRTPTPPPDEMEDELVPVKVEPAGP
jgi:hypothetical protein